MNCEHQWSAICQLEASENDGIISVQTQMIKNQECPYPRAGEDGCPSSALPTHFCPTQVLNRSNDHPPAVVFTQSSDSKANLFQKHPDKYTEKQRSTSYLGNF